jgi:hypothetical protein
MARFITLALVLSASPLAAQQSLVGVWDVSYTAGMHVENGVSTPVPGTGVLTITAHGDSLIGDLVNKAVGDLPARPPIRMVATERGDKTSFTALGKATMMRNGSKSEATVISTWVLSAAGDRLEGTVARKIEGIDSAFQGAEPVTGNRRKG